MVICLERGVDLHMAQMMPLPLTVSCFSKIQIGFTFLVPAHLGSPGQRAVKRVCCVAVKVLWNRPRSQISGDVMMKCADEQHNSEGRGDDTEPTQNLSPVSRSPQNFDFHSPTPQYITCTPTPVTTMFIPRQ